VEIGVMKGVGWQSRHVEQVFLKEAFLLSLAGGLAGFLLGWGVALLLGQLPLPVAAEPAVQTIQSMAMVPTETEVLKLPVRVDALTLGLTVVASVLGGTFAGWSSARRAARLKPAQSLSER
jgi:ABC-type antimicrobial peptide transport system permease subunit